MAKEEQEPANTDYAKSEELAAKVLEVVGVTRLNDSEDAEEYCILAARMGIVGGALGVATAKLMVGVSDQSFEDWIEALRNQRAYYACHAYHIEHGHA